MIKNQPNWEALLNLYMKEYYPNKYCVVFCNPLGNFEIVKNYFSIEEQTEIINADYSILECSSEDEAIEKCNSCPSFCMVWNNGFIHDHGV